MKIYLGEGLDQFIFGLTNIDVIKKLGKPNKINPEERDGFIVYYYNQIMTKFFFSIEEENRLVTIEVFSSDIKLWNYEIIGMNISEIKDLLDKKEIHYGDIEDYDIFETIFCKEIWAVFEFRYDRLKSVEFSVLRDKNGELIWPRP